VAFPGSERLRDDGERLREARLHHRAAAAHRAAGGGALRRPARPSAPLAAEPRLRLPALHLAALAAEHPRVSRAGGPAPGARRRAVLAPPARVLRDLVVLRT